MEDYHVMCCLNLKNLNKANVDTQNIFLQFISSNLNPLDIFLLLNLH